MQRIRQIIEVEVMGPQTESRSVDQTFEMFTWDTAFHSTEMGIIRNNISLRLSNYLDKLR